MYRLIFKLWMHLCQDTHTHTRTHGCTDEGTTPPLCRLTSHSPPVKQRQTHTHWALFLQGTFYLNVVQLFILLQMNECFQSCDPSWERWAKEEHCYLSCCDEDLGKSCWVWQRKGGWPWSRGRGSLATDPGSRQWTPGLWKFRVSHQSELCITFNEVG